MPPRADGHARRSCGRRGDATGCSARCRGAVWCDATSGPWSSLHRAWNSASDRPGRRRSRYTRRITARSLPSRRLSRGRRRRTARRGARRRSRARSVRTSTVSCPSSGGMPCTVAGVALSTVRLPSTTTVPCSGCGSATKCSWWSSCASTAHSPEFCTTWAGTPSASSVVLGRLARDARPTSRPPARPVPRWRAWRSSTSTRARSGRPITPASAVHSASPRAGDGDPLVVAGARVHAVRHHRRVDVAVAGRRRGR